MSRILCPVDFSDTSLNAIEYATELAEKNQSVLKLLYVFTENEFNTIVDVNAVSKSYKELLNMAEKRLKNIASEVNIEGHEKGLLSCETEIALGSLRDTILKYCNSGDYEMVVMGTTGMGKNVFMGSNSSYIVQKSNIPVMIVPNKANFDGFRKIIYATDLEEDDKIKLQDTISLATQFDSRITVLHLNEYHNMVEKSVINDFFEEMRSFLRYDKLRYHSFDYSGSLSDGLMNYLDENNGDLLVVYSKHRSFLQGLTHASVSKRLSVISQKPLLVLK